MNYFSKVAQLAGLRIYQLLRYKIPHHLHKYKGCSEYDNKLHLVVRLWFLSSWKYGVILHCHYSQVSSDRDCKNLLKF